MLLGQIQKVPSGKLAEGGEGVAQKPVFAVKMKPLLYTREPENPFRNPRPKRIRHTSGDETAVHFWTNGLRHADMT